MCKMIFRVLLFTLLFTQKVKHTSRKKINMKVFLFVVYVINSGPPNHFNLFLSTIQTSAVRDTDVCRHNGGTRGFPIMPRDVSLSDSKCLNGGHEWVNVDCHHHHRNTASPIYGTKGPFMPRGFCL